MKSRFLLFSLLFFTFTLSAIDRCYCGTSWDSQVDRIGDKICGVLVEMELMKPSKYYEEINEYGNDDDALYITARKWEPTDYARNWWKVTWSCEYVHYHRFSAYHGSLNSAEEALVLLEELRSDLDRIRKVEVDRVGKEIRDLKYSYYPYEPYPRSQMKEERKELLEELEKNKNKCFKLDRQVETVA